MPLLLTQIWPQYRTGRILWLYKNGDIRWKKEKEQVEKELSSIGKLTIIFLGKIYRKDGPMHGQTDHGSMYYISGVFFLKNFFDQNLNFSQIDQT